MAMPYMFLNGGAMRGGPLHHLLDGAPLVGVVRTAPKYRFYSVGDRFPALDPAPAAGVDGTGAGTGPDAAAASGAGVSVLGELYDVPWHTLRDRLLPAEPEELELGVIELEDGSGTLAMVRRRGYDEPPDAYRDISEHADWRAYTRAAAESGH
jgi:hypothetical protein